MADIAGCCARPADDTAARHAGASDAVARLLTWPGCFSSPIGDATNGSSRNKTLGYDAPGRVTTYSVATDEHVRSGGTLFPRSWNASDAGDYDPEGRLTHVIGPDGQDVTYSFDEAGRLSSVTRGSGESAMFAEYFYDDAGRVIRVEYLNGTKVHYHYDDAGRLQYVRHADASDATLFRVDYYWNLNNQP
jgi:YD repeat-containing protein